MLKIFTISVCMFVCLLYLGTENGLTQTNQQKPIVNISEVDPNNKYPVEEQDKYRLECDEQKIGESCYEYARISSELKKNKQAYDYYKKAFDLGDTIAGSFLAYFHLNHKEIFTNETQPDIDETIYYLEQAFEIGDPNAARMLRAIYISPKYNHVDFKKAEYYAKVAVKKNVKDSRLMLASIYMWDMKDFSKTDESIQLLKEDLRLDRNLLSAQSLMSIYISPKSFGREQHQKNIHLGMAYAYIITRDLKKEDPNNPYTLQINVVNDYIQDTEKSLTTEDEKKIQDLYKEIKVEIDTYTEVMESDSAAFKWHTKAAYQGLAKSQFQVGMMYYNGKGVKQSYSKAVMWYTKAANQGYPAAQYNLGLMYKRGEGVTQSYGEAIKWFTKATNQGLAEAQSLLGLMYYKGKGVTQSYDEAVKWYTKAAKQGYVEAQFNLGLMYYKGQGVTQSYDEAVKWCTKAAYQGDTKAQFNLGVMYYKGKVLTQSYDEAVKWYTKAANQDSVDAQFNLGLMYYNGEGVTKSDREAVKWYTKAAKQGYAEAQFNLGLMYYKGQGVTQSYDEAVKWYTKAANQDDIRAQYNLGLMYYKGQGVTQSYDEAVKLYAKSANQGLAPAQYELGVMYINGQGVTKNTKLATQLLKKSCDNEYQDACLTMSE